MITRNQYFSEREKLLKLKPHIQNIEYEYANTLLHAVLFPIAEDIYKDFEIRPFSLLPFWRNYPPEQRGRQPTGQSIPWLELGEKSISSNLIKQISKTFRNITFPGLPTGGDVRFATNDALVHLDIKLTGPNDNPNEIVVPPNQVSGDGKHWENNAIRNSNFPIYYQSKKKLKKINYYFQPKLPPFYMLENRTLICLTFFLEAIYGVKDYGNHPLEHFELSCVPNGLLLFDGPTYANNQGLFIAGKDDKSKEENSKRIRVRLTPLAQIDRWRSVMVHKDEEGWKIKYRIPDDNEKMELF